MEAAKLHTRKEKGESTSDIGVQLRKDSCPGGANLIPNKGSEALLDVKTQQRKRKNSQAEQGSSMDDFGIDKGKNLSSRGAIEDDSVSFYQYHSNLSTVCGTLNV